MSCAPSLSFKAIGRLFAEKELLALKIQGKDGDLDDEDSEGNLNYHMTRTASRAIFVEKLYEKKSRTRVIPVK